MAKLMYRCPRTGVNVDIWLADEVTPVSADTRARDRLLVSGVQPASEFLNDLK